MMHNQLTEEYKKTIFTLSCTVMRKNVEKIQQLNLRELGRKPDDFRVENVTHHSMAVAKHHLKKLVFNKANQKFNGFQDDPLRVAENASETAAQAFIEELTYAKKAPHLKNTKKKRGKPGD